MRSKRASHGFTLIEVMVALAIVVVAFVAMYGSMMQVVAGVSIMQDKTLATWIAFDRITEIRVSDKFPGDSDTRDEIEMAGLEWIYTIESIPTESEDVKRLLVKVSLADDPDNILGMAVGAVKKPSQGTTGTPGQPGNQGGITR